MMGTRIPIVLHPEPLKPTTILPAYIPYGPGQTCKTLDEAMAYAKRLKDAADDAHDRADPGL
jgi:hypothetical protein